MNKLLLIAICVERQYSLDLDKYFEELDSTLCMSLTWEIHPFLIRIF